MTEVDRFDTARDGSAFALHPDWNAMKTGFPMIFAQCAYRRSLDENADVARDGRHSAACALSDATQTSETKRPTMILTFAHRIDPILLLIERLRLDLSRHVVNSESTLLESRGVPVAKAIIAWCREYEPDLLVMGVYKPSKFHEGPLGGVTDTALKDMQARVLLAH